MISSTVGSPYYMAPERVVGTANPMPASHAPAYDYAVDVWSLGCILYEVRAYMNEYIDVSIGVQMGALQPVFGADKHDLVSLHRHILAADYPPLPCPAYSDTVYGRVV